MVLFFAKRFVMLAAILIAATYAHGQQPTVQPTPAEPVPSLLKVDPDKRADRPLTPQEERERLIRLYDPARRGEKGLDDRFGDRVPDAATLPSRGAGLEESRPQPGPSIRGSGPTLRNPTASSGPAVEPTVDNSAQDYAGPSVLSRSYTLSRPSSPKTIRWTPTVGYSSVFNTGLPGIGPNTAGTSSLGSQLTWGLSASRSWKWDRLDVGYFGSANSYYGTQRYSGVNQALTVGYSRILSRRIKASVSQNFTSTNQSYSLENQSLSTGDLAAGLSLATTPVISAYDQGTRQASTSANLSWQKTARTLFSFGGGAFVVERGGAGFVGTTGYQAQGDVRHRYSSRLTLGLYYSYANYVSSKHVSVTGSNTGGGLVSYQVDRRTQASLKVGLSQAETLSLSRIALDPLIAAILGQPSAVVVAFQKSNFKDVAATVARDLGHRRTVTASYVRGLAPGNGLIQASSREGISAGFGAPVFRRFNLNVGFNSDRLNAVDASAAAYGTRGGQLSVSRSLAKGVVSSFSVDYRTFTGVGTQGLSRQLRLSSGVSWGRNDGKMW
ncbi:MAG: hypothetical protein JWN34_4720 [Bryobacterales bacterium]|nr:hypothetical protein [Bryobacterales bacterium]